MIARRLRVALVADLLSEAWPSMDLTADRLEAELSALGRDANLEVQVVRPLLKPRRGQLGRYVNRFVDYTWWLRRHAPDVDVFHVIDHSYAHLVHVLPASRTVVTCHDIDAFLRLVDPDAIRSRLPTVITRTILSGLRRAAHVVCDSETTRRELLQFDLLPAARLSVAHLGAHPAFGPHGDDATDAEVARRLGAKQTLEVLHVGSCIQRKRIDVLLNALAQMVASGRNVRLLKAGGQLTDAQRAQATCLGVDRHMVQLPRMETRSLAALYRRADVVLITSDREGFGLPVLEALASGTAVVASDIPALREAGGGVTSYVPVGDAAAFSAAALTAATVDQSPNHADRRAARVAHAAGFSWNACARSMLTIYQRLAEPANAATAATMSGVGTR